MNALGSIVCSIAQVFGGCHLKDDVLPVITFTRDMDINELSSILIDKFPDAPIYLPDLNYKVCSKEDINRFLFWDDTENVKYQLDAFDCDDYSWRLKGQITIFPWSQIPFFVIWTDKHALCGFVDDKGSFYFVEPQSNKIQTELEDWQGSQIRFIGG